MDLITTKKQLSEIKIAYKASSKTLALVPTMGALHEGHLSLVKIAKEYADLVMVSIFVNPLQFGPNEDFSKYPRTLDRDLELLKTLEVDFVFAPGPEEMYATKPNEIKANPELANKLCGLSRPGHFDGVCTVVNLLFELIEPDYAIFGQKDLQQLKIIEDMVLNLNLPVKIIPAPIMREANGLAMSSRNQYLTESQKDIAANIYQELSWLKTNYSDDNVKKVKSKLSELGIEVEYLESHWGQVLIAACIHNTRSGSTRLIDNVELV